MTNLKERYPKVNIESTQKNRIHIRNLWSDDSFFLRFDKKEDISFFDHLHFPTELVAHYSLKENFMEVFAAPLPKGIELVKRKFDFHYKGYTFQCYFDTPTEYFKKIATAFREQKEESKTAYRNLRQFRDLYRIDELPEFMAKYLSDKKPYNFFVKGPISKIEDELINFCKTLNFYMLYFNRETPVLQIFSKPYNRQEYNQPCLSLFDNFPESVNAMQIDDVLLDIITIANNSTDVRLRFIFYYQILEYASYYFLKSDVKHRLKAILRKPDISYRSEEYSKTIIEEFKNHFKNNDDKAKLDMLIADTLTLKELKSELESNIEYFSKKIEFDGGFTIQPIMKYEISGIEQLPENILKTIKENIVDIRNCLVHLRESRENRVILPTDRNDDLIMPYLYVLRRIAEIVIMN